jgi:hypothetical protein
MGSIQISCSQLTGQTQVPNYIQFVEQMLQAYKITRNNMLKLRILSNKYADISKNHVEGFHQEYFQ